MFPISLRFTEVSVPWLALQTEKLLPVREQ